MATNTTHYQGFTAVAGQEQWRASQRDLDCNWPGVLASGNTDIDGSGGPSYYGWVKPGTVLAKDSEGALHPCGLMELEDAVASANTATLVDASNFYVGDVVAVVGLATEVDVAITGEADSETFTTVGAVPHGFLPGDDIELVAGFTGGTGATAGKTTVATVPSATTLTLTGVAFTTDITAGSLRRELAEPRVTNKTGSRNVSSVNKTTGDVVVDGATFSANAGDLMVKVNAYKPVGILVDSVTTVIYEQDGTSRTQHVDVSYSYSADIRASKCPGLGAKLKEILNGMRYPDPLDPDVIVQSEFTGFVVRDY